MITAFPINRIPACSVAEIAVGGLAVREVEEGWQDKGPRCAARSVGCFPLGFCFAPRCTQENRDVRARDFLNSSNNNHTSRALKP
jgi:hypothetical protein